jgi:predicted nucleotide-binding protein (sugar kinase/HSP70/actin superfamily)
VSAELLRKAADALDDGQVPLVNPFLSDHEVTLDQCMSLAQQLAIGARIVAKAIESPRSPQGIAMLMTIAEGKLP